MGFPEVRMRRLRRSAVLREMLAETKLTVKDLVAPLSCVGASMPCNSVASLPGVVQHTVESLVKEARRPRAPGSRPCTFRVPSQRDAEDPRLGPPMASSRWLSHRCATSSVPRWS